MNSRNWTDDGLALGSMNGLLNCSGLDRREGEYIFSVFFLWTNFYISLRSLFLLRWKTELVPAGLMGLEGILVTCPAVQPENPVLTIFQ